MQPTSIPEYAKPLPRWSTLIHQLVDAILLLAILAVSGTLMWQAAC